VEEALEARAHRVGTAAMEAILINFSLIDKIDEYENDIK